MPPARSYPQQLRDQFGDSDPTGLKLFAVGGVGVVFGVGVLIGSQVIFTQQVSPVVWKIIVGAIGVGLPIGLSGGILLIESDPPIEYIGGGLVSSLGALLLFEITYPISWATKYYRVGTFAYVSGVIVLLGLAAWVMRDWFESDVDSTETGTESIEANDEEKVDGDSEPASTDDESDESGSERGADTDSSERGDVGTTSQGKHHDDQHIPLEVRVKNVNAEVRRLETQLNRAGVSGSEPELDALESRVEEVTDRINDMMPEIARLVDQTWALEKNLDELRSGFDRVGSETAQSVERVQRKFPDFRGHDAPRGAAPGAGSAPSARRHSVPRGAPDRASTRRPTGEQRKRQTRSSSTAQRRIDSEYRRSNQSRKKTDIPRQASQDRSLAERVNDHPQIKAFLVVLSVSVIISISFLVTAISSGAG